MPNHLTPDELSKEVGIERDEVIRICVEEHVPIYQGKIDKTSVPGATRRDGRDALSSRTRAATPVARLRRSRLEHEGRLQGALRLSIPLAVVGHRPSVR